MIKIDFISLWKEYWPNGKKLEFLLTYQIKNIKPRVLAKNPVIQAYYQKIDFIEKTCASYHFSQVITFYRHKL